jgi:hypothetical protein
MIRTWAAVVESLGETIWMRTGRFYTIMEIQQFAYGNMEVGLVRPEQRVKTTSLSMHGANHVRSKM